MDKKKIISRVFMVIMLLLIVSCYTILVVLQPSSAVVGEKIRVQVQVQTDPDPTFGLDTDPKPQIASFLIPNDWTVDTVFYVSEDASPLQGGYEFLPNATYDRYPGDGTGSVDYWSDTLEVLYPSGSERKWVTYQSNEDVSITVNTAVHDLFVDFIVGQSEGTFDIGYFLTNASLDFDQD